MERLKYLIAPLALSAALCMPAAALADGGTAAEPFAERLYAEVLDRQADEAGLSDQVRALNDGTAPAEIAYNYFNSEEYRGKDEPAGRTVERVYRVMFGRDSDAEGKAMWVSYLEDGMSVRAVIAGFSQSIEYKEYFSNLGVNNSTIGVIEPRDQSHGITAFCSRLYTKCLGRDFDASGINAQAAAILTGTSASEIAKNFFTFEEFASQGLSNSEAIERCYETMMNRASDAGGKAFWESKMASGATVGDLVEGFSQSDEWKGICNDYGLDENGSSPNTATRKWVAEQGHYEDVYTTVHHDAVTHEEPVYTTVVDQEAYDETVVTYVCSCGYTTTSKSAMGTHMNTNAHSGGIEYTTIHHDAVTHQEQTGTKTVVDQAAYDEQVKTGSRWVVDVEAHWE